MFRKLFCGFCNQVQKISSFNQLKNIMNPPTTENYQRLQKTVQQLIQSNPINWKFVHRLQLLKSQFGLELNMPYLLSKLKDQPIDSEKQSFVVEIMQQNFMVDKELFKELFQQLLKMDDLFYSTQLKMLDIYFKYPELLDQDKILPNLLKSLITFNDLELYEIVQSFQVLAYKDTKLTEQNQELLANLKNMLNNQLVKIFPALGQKHFRQLIVFLRSNEYHNEKLKAAIFQYFSDNKDILGQSSYAELMSLCNLKFFYNEDIKYQILIQLNFLKVKGLNESKLINKSILPSMSQAEQEMMANLITLSGINLDKEFINTYFTGSNSQKREKLEQMNLKENQIIQIVEELVKYINQQFPQFLNVMKIVQTFGLQLPELLQPLVEELKKILSKQVVNSADLITILNYFDESDILFDQEDSMGMQDFNNYLKQEQFTYGKIHYLLRQFAFKKNQDLLFQILNKSYQSGWTLDLCSKQVQIYKYYNIPLPPMFLDKFQQVINEYILKRRSPFDQILFYRCIEMADWSQNLRSEQSDYFNESQNIAQKMRREKTKNLDQSSFLEQEIKNDLMQYMPKTLKLQANQYIKALEVDFVITNQKGDQLFVQILGQTHFYYKSTILNYKTLLEQLYLERLGTCKSINYYQTDQWKQDKQKSVDKLISSLI
ncbi:unnamed protein product [Paramecium sonneborni]|uniref:RAP domain-containing protein n=1 Tax=Paramecium sonneborni TaxID=65129 RepID=A0A8S1R1E5_9CILI|nr:unnamed protein product [Paramecium sonneborni]